MANLGAVTESQIRLRRRRQIRLTSEITNIAHHQIARSGSVVEDEGAGSLGGNGRPAGEVADVVLQKICNVCVRVRRGVPEAASAVLQTAEVKSARPIIDPFDPPLLSPKTAVLGIKAEAKSSLQRQEGLR